MASAIRGSRVGAGPMGEAERGDQIERATVSYGCANGHEVRPSFAVEETVVIPDQWDCPKCGLPAGRDKNNPPSAVVNIPYKTHLAYVKERRTDKEGEKILEDALRKLRGDDIE
jgi:rubredoxin